MGDVLAYLITFRCYGTWVHGDPRGSTMRRGAGLPAENLVPDERRQEAEFSQRGGPPQHLSAERRHEVELAMREVCQHRGWMPLAVNVRTNHVHAVIAAPEVAPERVLNDLKAYATRRLRRTGLATPEERVWSRHGSTVYLWTDEEVAAARHYVEYRQ